MHEIRLIIQKTLCQSFTTAACLMKSRVKIMKSEPSLYGFSIDSFGWVAWVSRKNKCKFRTRTFSPISQNYPRSSPDYYVRFFFYTFVFIHRCFSELYKPMNLMKCIFCYAMKSTCWTNWIVILQKLETARQSQPDSIES